MVIMILYQAMLEKFKRESAQKIVAWNVPCQETVLIPVIRPNFEGTEELDVVVNQK